MQIVRTNDAILSSLKQGVAAALAQKPQIKEAWSPKENKSI
jgi:hypothetical protein